MKKILNIILILGLIGIIGLLNLNMEKVKAEEYQIEELIFLNESLNELRGIYGEAEGYGDFVKSKFIEKVNNDIPKEWLVPTDENGIWRASTSDYYTIILTKELNWKIKKFIRDDYNNEEIPELSLSKFINPLLNSFPPTPNNIIELPNYIKNEINKFSVKIILNNYIESNYRNNNPSYSWTWNPCKDYYHHFIIVYI